MGQNGSRQHRQNILIVVTGPIKVLGWWEVGEESSVVGGGAIAYAPPGSDRPDQVSLVFITRQQGLECLGCSTSVVAVVGFGMLVFRLLPSGRKQKSRQPHTVRMEGTGHYAYHWE